MGDSLMCDDRALAATEPKGGYNPDHFRDSTKKVTEQP